MHPVLFQWGPITIGSYGVCVLLGMGAGYVLFPRYARRYGLDPALSRRMFFTVFLAGALGCRLLNVFLRFPEVLENPSVVPWLMQQAGVWYGAILGGVGAGVWFAWRHRLSFWTMIDTSAVPAVLGGGIGRLGCLLSGCCFGTPSDRPWAITYTNELAHRLHPDLPYGSLHPTPLYELGIAILLAIALDRVGARRLPTGTVGLLWIASYGVARSVLELFRGDEIRGRLAIGLTTSQAIGVTATVAALALIVWRWNRAERAGPDLAPRPGDVGTPAAVAPGARRAVATPVAAAPGSATNRTDGDR